MRDEDYLDLPVICRPAGGSGGPGWLGYRLPGDIAETLGIPAGPWPVPVRFLHGHLERTRRLIDPGALCAFLMADRARPRPSPRHIAGTEMQRALLAHLAGGDIRERVLAGGTDWRAEFGPAAPSGPAVGLQAHARTLALLTPGAEAALRITCFEPLDHCVAGMLLDLVRRRPPADGQEAVSPDFRALLERADAFANHRARRLGRPHLQAWPGGLKGPRPGGYPPDLSAALPAAQCGIQLRLRDAWGQYLDALLDDERAARQAACDRFRAGGRGRE